VVSRDADFGRWLMAAADAFCRNLPVLGGYVEHMASVYSTDFRRQLVVVRVVAHLYSNESW
jgi:hypothetical protein